MRKVFWGLLFVLGVLIGYFYEYGSSKRPYQLDYKRIVINLPLGYSRDLYSSDVVLGEKYLAQDMRVELKRLGYDVKLYSKEDTFSNRNFREGIELYMREEPELFLGRYHDFFDKDRVSVLYETVPYSNDVLKNADIVFTGSLKKNRENIRNGYNSYFLPQFTIFDKFYYDYKEEYRSRLLYVANRWSGFETRKTIEYALRNNIEIDVYGIGWDDLLIDDKKSWYKGKQIRNEDLRYYYSSADIVLNDTRDDMVKAGFISNRIFDATACGAFVISDYIEEIEEIYGDSIVMYKSEEEFVKLIEHYLANKDERIEKAKRAQQITLSKFGSKKVIGEMVEVIEKYVDKIEEY